MFVPMPIIQTPSSALYDAIVAAGLTTNLQVCLDAGDPISYPGTGTKWLDRSGNGYDFFLGTDGTTNAPTFVSSGRRSYFSFSGTTFFRYDTTNEAWMQTLHKDNAVFSAIVLNYKSSSSPGYFGTGATTTGINNANPGSGNLSVVNASVDVITKTGDTTASSSAWHFGGLSLTEATGAGGGFFYLDGGYNQVAASNTWNSTYTLPAAGSASFTMEIGARGNANTPAASGSRISCIAIWSGTAISKANCDTLWASMRGRFGL